jgi:hypothetical protein
VKIAIQPFGPEHERAAAAFNARMHAASAPTAFLMSERAASPVRCGSVSMTQFVAVDRDEQVRGGVICQEHPALLAGRLERVVNIQSPLSEGIVNPAFTFVAPLLVKHALRQTPYAFVVGMGNAANPLPRLLKAMGWTVREVPFYFQLLRPARCLRRLAPLRRTRWTRVLADAAARTGLAALGARIAHRASAPSRAAASAFRAAPVREWAEWADSVWDAAAPALSFGVVRTRDTLPFFYPLDNRSPRVWTVARDAGTEGWFGLLVARMSRNVYFGDLVVATLTDCLGTADAVRAATVLAVQQASADGADILITNQQHRLMQECCVSAGWRRGPSNFLLATSRELSERLDPATTYITRRDGDGLVNLGT